jgi:hypothetical protein
MTYYLTRRMAALAAIRAGLRNFQTRIDPINRPGWKFESMSGESPAKEWAKGKDFVHHVESDWIDQGRSPGYMGVLVVSCMLDEITPAEQAEIKALGFRIEPLTPDLFGGKDETSPRARTTGSTTGQRAKSDAESPVKVVWRIADEMKGQDRKAIVEACVTAGVNKSTAMTQFYKWQKAQST